MSDSAAAAGPVLLATGGYDQTVNFWEAHTGVCKRTCHHADSQVNALSFRPDRTLLAAAGYCRVRLYDVSSSDMAPVLSVEGLEKNVTAVGFQSDSRWMFSGGEDRLAQIWDVKTSGAQCQRMFQAERPLNSVVLHPNQVELFMADTAGTIYQWDLRSDNHCKLTTNSQSSINQLDIDTSGRLLSAVDAQGSCYIWSLVDGDDQNLSTVKLKGCHKIHDRYALKCRFSPDGSLLATTWAGSSVHIWRVSDFTLHRQLVNDSEHCHSHWVWDCAFSSDAKYLVTASSDENARLWCIETAEVVCIYKGHSKALTALAFADPV